MGSETQLWLEIAMPLLLQDQETEGSKTKATRRRHKPDDSQFWLELAVPLGAFELTEGYVAPKWRKPSGHAPLPVNNHFEWTDQDIIKVADGLLKMTVRALFDGRNNQKVRNAAWAWVLAPDAPSGEPVRQITFEICCRLIGVDHEDLRDMLVHEQGRRTRAAAKAAKSAYAA